MDLINSKLLKIKELEFGTGLALRNVFGSTDKVPEPIRLD